MMGTSSAFIGPTKNPLLPDDFDDNSWKNTRTEFSKFLNSNGGNPHRLYGKYVKASGGSATLGRSAQGGKLGFVNTVNLLNQINSIGLVETLETFKIASEGKSLDTIFSELVNYIAPVGNSKEEAVARQATLETMTFFYELVVDKELDLKIVNSISGDMLDELICNYFINYISNLLLTDLGYGVEKYIDNPALLEGKEQELRDYVEISIGVMLTNNQLNQKPQKIIDKVFKEAFEIIGGYYE